MLNGEGTQEHTGGEAHLLQPRPSQNRLRMAGLALIALLGTSHPLAVPGIHTPKPSTTTCHIQPSMLWLQPLVQNGPPQQTVQVQFEVAEAGRAAIPNTSFIQASVNGTQARVANAEWLTPGLMSLLVVVPQSFSSNRPTRHSVQVSMAGSQCSQSVVVPAMPQWNVYVPECADAQASGSDTEGFLQSLLPLAKLGRLSATLSDNTISSWGMASALAHAGIVGIVSTHPPALSNNPGLFWWAGPDGARVLMNAPVSDVTAQPSAAQNDAQTVDPLVRLISHTAGRYATLKQIGRYPADAFLLDCNSFSTAPLSSDEIAQWNSRFAYPHIAGGQDAFFTDMATRYGDQLTTVRGGLDTQWNASLAANVETTQHLRADAADQLNAQTLAAIASTQGYSPTLGQHLNVEAALDALASQINTGPAAGPAAGPASTMMTDTVEPNPYVVVFNPLAWERSTPVTMTIEGDAALYLTDISTGNTINSQRIAPNTLLFIAPDVPALGYKVFRLEGRQPDASLVQSEAFSVTQDATTGEPILSSARFSLTADLGTGGVVLFDKVLDPLSMSGTLDGRAILGNQALYSVDGAILRPTNLAAKVVSSGPVAAQLQITGQFTQGHISSFTQTATLLNSLPYIVFENAVEFATDNAACSTGSCPVERLYFSYPIDLAEPEMRADSIGSITNLGTDPLPGVRRDDYAVQSFVNVSVNESGATLAMPDIPFVELGGLRTQQGFRTQPASGQVFALAYATANQLAPDPAGPHGPLHWQVGWMPQALAFDPTASVQWGWSQRRPLLTWRLPANQHGSLPGTSRSYGPLVIGDENNREMLVSALKPAEDGHGLILRLWNPSSFSQTVSLDLGALGVQQLQVADGLERPLGDVEPALNTRPIIVNAQGFVTLRLLREGLPAVPPTSPPTALPNELGSTSPLPTPANLSATLPLVTAEALPTLQLTASPSAPLPVSTYTDTPVPSATPVVASPTPEITPLVPTAETATSTPAPETPVPVVSATVVVVNAGNTPTVQVTVPPVATNAPPVPTPTTAPFATATATPPVTTVITSTPTTQPLATVAGTSAVTPSPTSAVPPTTAPSSRSLPVLDSFDGDGPVSTNKWIGNTTRYVIRANQLISGTSGNDIYNIMYWATPFSATQEVAVRFAAIALDENSPNFDNSVVRLMLKWQSSGTIAMRCYAVRVSYDFSDKRVRVEYCDNEANANIWEAARISTGTFNNVTLVAGDTFGARIDDAGLVQVFKNGTLIGTADVGGVSGWNFVSSDTGKVGLWYNDIPNVALDDFSGK